MGTFHHDRHELHGITVVVDTSGPEIFVGRCDDMDDRQILGVFEGETGAMLTPSDNVPHKGVLNRGTVNLGRNDRERPRDVGVLISLSHTILWSESTLGA